MPIFKTVFVLFLFAFLEPAFSTNVDPRSQSYFYVETYGTVDPEKFPLARRVSNIFKRIVRVADKSRTRLPSLRLIDSENSHWAIALPDNTVVLTRGAIEICYNNVTRELGDARMAFVLGHEVAHLADDDFWHRDVFLSLSQPEAAAELERIQSFIGESAGLAPLGSNEKWQNIVQQRELKADDKGFLFAAIAGYDTASLIDSSVSGDNFFRFWLKQTRAIEDDLRVTTAERVAFLKLRLSELVAKLPLFQAGSILAYSGRYASAELLLREVLKSFPSYEVFTNLGYIYLQQARAAMDSVKASRFWFPSLLESQTLLGSLVRDTTPAGEKVVRENLLRAIEFFDTATRLNVRHVPSRLNLAVAYFYAGEYFKARAVIEELKLLQPDDDFISGIRAVVMYVGDKEVDMSPVATHSLSQLAEADGLALHHLYNLARILEETGKTSLASDYWNQLSAQVGQIPLLYSDRICDAIKDSSECRDSVLANDFYVSAPVEVDDLRTNKSSIKQLLQSSSITNRQAFNIDGKTIETVSREGASIVTAVNEKIELAIFRQPPDLTLDELEMCCGLPRMVFPWHLGRVQIHNDGWSFLVSNGIVKEIWFSPQLSR